SAPSDRRGRGSVARARGAADHVLAASAFSWGAALLVQIFLESGGPNVSTGNDSRLDAQPVNNINGKASSSAYPSRFQAFTIDDFVDIAPWSIVRTAAARVTQILGARAEAELAERSRPGRARLGGGRPHQQGDANGRNARVTSPQAPPRSKMGSAAAQRVSP